MRAIDPGLRARTESWIAGDPDPKTRGELKALLEVGDVEGVTRAMGATLTFGTAGIRGEVGPGSNRMNQAMVVLTTAGLASHLRANGRGDLPVILGWDARPSSRGFAEDVAGVLAAAGIAVKYFEDVIPTPVVAFAASELGAGAAVVITASHNPPADNGYKVYSGNAAQIIPPEDEMIAAAIAASGHANEVERVERAFSTPGGLVGSLGASVVESYYRAVLASRPAPIESDLTFVYTPLHGVGGRVLPTLFERAGHRGLTPVPSQFEPDGSFPTVTFPNPEEEGALDLALELAEELGAAAVIANDPDADRLAAAVPDKGSWRVLSGNELGAILGDYVLDNWHSTDVPIVANSIVSSPILEVLADRYGATHVATLTGFKWIANAGLALETEGVGRFSFGFEEALGYTIGDTVRDKDGLSAAVVLADLVAEEQTRGRSLIDRLHDIWRITGIWVSAQHSIVRPGPAGSAAIDEAVNRLGDKPPARIGSFAVSSVTDYRTGGDERPPWLGEQQLISLGLGKSGRLLIRPSGTEPKLKIYVDLRGDTEQDPDSAYERLKTKAENVAVEMGEWLAL